MRKPEIIIFCVFFQIAAFISCYGQEETARAEKRELKTVNCKVAAIDWVGSLLVVRVSDDATSDEITFVVPRSAQITKGTDSISFSDLNVEDRVTVTYTDEGLAGLRATRIIVSV